MLNQVSKHPASDLVSSPIKPAPRLAFLLFSFRSSLIFISLLLRATTRPNPAFYHPKYVLLTRPTMCYLLQVTHACGHAAPADPVLVTGEGCAGSSETPKRKPPCVPEIGRTRPWRLSHVCGNCRPAHTAVESNGRQTPTVVPQSRSLSSVILPVYTMQASPLTTQDTSGPGSTIPGPVAKPPTRKRKHVPEGENFIIGLSSCLMQACPLTTHLKTRPGVAQRIPGRSMSPQSKRESTRPKVRSLL
jgi:hypothetical protein